MKVPVQVSIYVGKNNIARPYCNNIIFSKWVRENMPYIFNFENVPFTGKIIDRKLQIEVFGLETLMELSNKALDDLIENVGIQAGGIVSCDFIFIRTAGRFEIVRYGSQLHMQCLLKKVKVFEKGRIYCNEKNEYLYFGKYFTKDINQKVIKINVFKELSDGKPNFVMFKKPCLSETNQYASFTKQELLDFVTTCQNSFYKKAALGTNVTLDNFYSIIFGKTLQFAMLYEKNDHNFIETLKKTMLSMLNKSSLVGQNELGIFTNNKIDSYKYKSLSRYLLDIQKELVLPQGFFQKYV